jgi:hypothetical protein
MPRRREQVNREEAPDRLAAVIFEAAMMACASG